MTSQEPVHSRLETPSSQGSRRVIWNGLDSTPQIMWSSPVEDGDQVLTSMVKGRVQSFVVSMKHMTKISSESRRIYDTQLAFAMPPNTDVVCHLDPEIPGVTLQLGRSREDRLHIEPKNITKLVVQVSNGTKLALNGIDFNMILNFQFRE